MHKKVLLLLNFPFEEQDGFMCEKVAAVLEEHAAFLRTHSRSVEVTGQIAMPKTGSVVRWDADPPIP